VGGHRSASRRGSGAGLPAAGQPRLPAAGPARRHLVRPGRQMARILARAGYRASIRGPPGTSTKELVPSRARAGMKRVRPPRSEAAAVSKTCVLSLREHQLRHVCRGLALGTLHDSAPASDHALAPRTRDHATPRGRAPRPRTAEPGTSAQLPSSGCRRLGRRRC
jgi:hypothetical protein